MYLCFMILLRYYLAGLNYTYVGSIIDLKRLVVSLDNSESMGVSTRNVTSKYHNNNEVCDLIFNPIAARAALFRFVTDNLQTERTNTN